MTAQRFAESVVEDAALAWLEALGYVVLHGPDISPGGDAPAPSLTLPRALRAQGRVSTNARTERGSYSEVVFEDRLRDVLVRLNPALPPEALEDAYRRLTRADAPTRRRSSSAIVRCIACWWTA
ncbi:MAG: hypothetical protein HY322_21595 [Betaproteobacteria bacterium]|nr:hypothetical protein [Betaproteobacteria bacterium]